MCVILCWIKNMGTTSVLWAACTHSADAARVHRHGAPPLGRRSGVPHEDGRADRPRPPHGRDSTWRGTATDLPCGCRRASALCSRVTQRRHTRSGTIAVHNVTANTLEGERQRPCGCCAIVRAAWWPWSSRRWRSAAARARCARQMPTAAAAAAAAVPCSRRRAAEPRSRITRRRRTRSNTIAVHDVAANTFEGERRRPYGCCAIVRAAR